MEEKFENLGGVYFPILDQDGNRHLIKINNDGKEGNHFLNYLRKVDRPLPKPHTSEEQ